MELFTETKSKNKKNGHTQQSLPPRRGQIKINILKTILKTTASFTHRHQPTSTPTTPPIPSGYTSDA
ncbi:hypothetical protein TanjilG_17165 [Lupinus angustifolius]|uniref:Uncharacterized protein n=1 Tax=Lupinus angustifolius TaxID=3871 RepID=A0A4P1R1D4_LUPAN|nr:hypothetical protein TanjilG_17165 [Lupinus angustifolius]